MDKDKLIKKATAKLVKEARSWSLFKTIAKNIAKGVVTSTGNTVKDKKVRKAIATSAEASLRAVAGYGALLVGGGIFAEALIDNLTILGVKRKSPQYYQKMLEAHPELKKQKPAEIAKLWASLYHFAPTMAADPLAAGAFIRQNLAQGYMQSVGGPPTDILSGITNIESSLQKSRATKDRGILKALMGTVPKKLFEPFSPDVEKVRKSLFPKDVK